MPAETHGALVAHLNGLVVLCLPHNTSSTTSTAADHGIISTVLGALALVRSPPHLNNATREGPSRPSLHFVLVTWRGAAVGDASLGPQVDWNMVAASAAVSCGLVSGSGPHTPNSPNIMALSIDVDSSSGAHTIAAQVVTEIRLKLSTDQESSTDTDIVPVPAIAFRSGYRHQRVLQKTESVLVGPLHLTGRLSAPSYLLREGGWDGSSDLEPTLDMCALDNGGDVTEGRVRVRLCAAVVTGREVALMCQASNSAICICSGVVDAVGRGVTRLKPNQAVVGLVMGPVRTFATTSQDSFTPAPDGMSHDHAAAAAHAFLGAFLALEHMVHGLDSGRERGLSAQGMVDLLAGKRVLLIPNDLETTQVVRQMYTGAGAHVYIAVPHGTPGFLTNATDVLGCDAVMDDESFQEDLGTLFSNNSLDLILNYAVDGCCIADAASAWVVLGGAVVHVGGRPGVSQPMRADIVQTVVDVEALGMDSLDHEGATPLMAAIGQMADVAELTGALRTRPPYDAVQFDFSGMPILTRLVRQHEAAQWRSRRLVHGNFNASQGLDDGYSSDSTNGSGTGTGTMSTRSSGSARSDHSGGGEHRNPDYSSRYGNNSSDSESTSMASSTSSTARSGRVTDAIILTMPWSAGVQERSAVMVCVGHGMGRGLGLLRIMETLSVKRCTVIQHEPKSKAAEVASDPLPTRLDSLVDPTWRLEVEFHCLDVADTGAWALVAALGLITHTSALTSWFFVLDDSISPSLDVASVPMVLDALVSAQEHVANQGDLNAILPAEGLTHPALAPICILVESYLRMLPRSRGLTIYTPAEQEGIERILRITMLNGLSTRREIKQDGPREHRERFEGKPQRSKVQTVIILPEPPARDDPTHRVEPPSQVQQQYQQEPHGHQDETAHTHSLQHPLPAMATMDRPTRWMLDGPAPGPAPVLHDVPEKDVLLAVSAESLATIQQSYGATSQAKHWRSLQSVTHLVPLPHIVTVGAPSASRKAISHGKAKQVIEECLRSISSQPRFWGMRMALRRGETTDNNRMWCIGAPETITVGLRGVASDAELGDAVFEVASTWTPLFSAVLVCLDQHLPEKGRPCEPLLLRSITPCCSPMLVLSAARVICDEESMFLLRSELTRCLRESFHGTIPEPDPFGDTQQFSFPAFARGQIDHQEAGEVRQAASMVPPPMRERRLQKTAHRLPIGFLDIFEVTSTYPPLSMFAAAVAMVISEESTDRRSIFSGEPKQSGHDDVLTSFHMGVHTPNRLEGLRGSFGPFAGLLNLHVCLDRNAKLSETVVLLHKALTDALGRGSTECDRQQLKPEQGAGVDPGSPLVMAIKVDSRNGEWPIPLGSTSSRPSPLSPMDYHVDMMLTLHLPHSDGGSGYVEALFNATLLQHRQVSTILSAVEDAMMRICVCSGAIVNDLRFLRRETSPHDSLEDVLNVSSLFSRSCYLHRRADMESATRVALETGMVRQLTMGVCRFGADIKECVVFDCSDGCTSATVAFVDHNNRDKAPVISVDALASITPRNLCDCVIPVADIVRDEMGRVLVPRLLSATNAAAASLARALAESRMLTSRADKHVVVEWESPAPFCPPDADAVTYTMTCGLEPDSLVLRPEEEVPLRETTTPTTMASMRSALVATCSQSARLGVTHVYPDGSQDRVSYAQLLGSSSELRWGLVEEKGVPPRGHVVICCEDMRDRHLVFWACLLGNLIPVVVGEVSSPDDVPMECWNTWQEHWAADIWVVCSNSKPPRLPLVIPIPSERVFLIDGLRESGCLGANDIDEDCAMDDVAWVFADVETHVMTPVTHQAATALAEALRDTLRDTNQQEVGTVAHNAVVNCLPASRQSMLSLHCAAVINACSTVEVHTSNFINSPLQTLHEIIQTHPQLIRTMWLPACAYTWKSESIPMPHSNKGCSNALLDAPAMSVRSIVVVANGNGMLESEAELWQSLANVKTRLAPSLGVPSDSNVRLALELPGVFGVATLTCSAADQNKFVRVGVDTWAPVAPPCPSPNTPPLLGSSSKDGATVRCFKSYGLALPGLQVRASDGQAGLPHGTMGILQVRGGQAILGDEWVSTGRMGLVSEAGVHLISNHTEIVEYERESERAAEAVVGVAAGRVVVSVLPSGTLPTLLVVVGLQESPSDLPPTDQVVELQHRWRRSVATQVRAAVEETILRFRSASEVSHNVVVWPVPEAWFSTKHLLAASRTLVRVALARSVLCNWPMLRVTSMISFLASNGRARHTMSRLKWSPRPTDCDHARVVPSDRRFLLVGWGGHVDDAIIKKLAAKGRVVQLICGSARHSLDASKCLRLNLNDQSSQLFETAISQRDTKEGSKRVEAIITTLMCVQGVQEGRRLATQFMQSLCKAITVVGADGSLHSFDGGALDVICIVAIPHVQGLGGEGALNKTKNKQLLDDAGLWGWAAFVWHRARQALARDFLTVPMPNTKLLRIQSNRVNEVAETAATECFLICRQSQLLVMRDKNGNSVRMVRRPTHIDLGDLRMLPSCRIRPRLLMYTQRFSAPHLQILRRLRGSLGQSGCLLITGEPLSDTFALALKADSTMNGVVRLVMGLRSRKMADAMRNVRGDGTEWTGVVVNIVDAIDVGQSKDESNPVETNTFGVFDRLACGIGARVIHVVMAHPAARETWSHMVADDTTERGRHSLVVTGSRIMDVMSEQAEDIAEEMKPAKDESSKKQYVRERRQGRRWSTNPDDSKAGLIGDALACATLLAWGAPELHEVFCDILSNQQSQAREDGTAARCGGGFEPAPLMRPCAVREQEMLGLLDRNSRVRVNHRVQAPITFEQSTQTVKAHPVARSTQTDDPPVVETQATQTMYIVNNQCTQTEAVPKATAFTQTHSVTSVHQSTQITQPTLVEMATQTISELPVATENESDNAVLTPTTSGIPQSTAPLSEPTLALPRTGQTQGVVEATTGKIPHHNIHMHEARLESSEDVDGANQASALDTDGDLAHSLDVSEAKHDSGAGELRHTIAVPPRAVASELGASITTPGREDSKEESTVEDAIKGTHTIAAALPASSPPSSPRDASEADPDNGLPDGERSATARGRLHQSRAPPFSAVLPVLTTTFRPPQVTGIDHGVQVDRQHGVNAEQDSGMDEQGADYCSGDESIEQQWTMLGDAGEMQSPRSMDNLENPSKEVAGLRGTPAHLLARVPESPQSAEELKTEMGSPARRSSGSFFASGIPTPVDFLESPRVHMYGQPDGQDLNRELPATPTPVPTPRSPTEAPQAEDVGPSRVVEVRDRWSTSSSDSQSTHPRSSNLRIRKKGLSNLSEKITGRRISDWKRASSRRRSTVPGEGPRTPSGSAVIE